MRIHVTNQIAPLARPGTRTSQLNRAFSAALGEFLRDGDRYAQLYASYINIAPRFPPSSCDCDRWDDVDPNDRAIVKMLGRGTLRLGFVAGAPYVYRQDGALTGFDHDLAETLAGIMSAHFQRELSMQWVEMTVTGDDQADKLAVLFDGLMDDSYDIALSGQMMLPDAYLGGRAIEWTAPTANLFTAVTYTGRDADKLDQTKLKALRSADLAAFQAYAIEESRRIPLELRIFSVVNPGPSPGAATGLVYALNHAGADSVWHAGDVSGSTDVMLERIDHFTVGDSLASGAQTKLAGFEGLYLDIPATDELWPIAGFTPGPTPDGQRQLAIYAEHSLSKKPMEVDTSLPFLQQGWNLRIFNRVEAQLGTSVRFEQGTGVVTLAAGTYHIVASSLVTYDDLAMPGRVSTVAEPYGGYCRLRYADTPGCDNDDAIAVGTMSTANMIPSLIDCMLVVKDEARIVLEHQVGNEVAHIYLEGIWANSTWHVFARIAVERL